MWYYGQNLFWWCWGLVKVEEVGLKEIMCIQDFQDVRIQFSRIDTSVKNANQRGIEGVLGHYTYQSIHIRCRFRKNKFWKKVRNFFPKAGWEVVYVDVWCTWFFSSFFPQLFRLWPTPNITKIDSDHNRHQGWIHLHVYCSKTPMIDLSFDFRIEISDFKNSSRCHPFSVL